MSIASEPLPPTTPGRLTRAMFAKARSVSPARVEDSASISSRTKPVPTPRQATRASTRAASASPATTKSNGKLNGGRAATLSNSQPLLTSNTRTKIVGVKAPSASQPLPSTRSSSSLTAGLPARLGGRASSMRSLSQLDDATPRAKRTTRSNGVGAGAVPASVPASQARSWVASQDESDDEDDSGESGDEVVVPVKKGKKGGSVPPKGRKSLW